MGRGLLPCCKPTLRAPQATRWVPLKISTTTQLPAPKLQFQLDWKSKLTLMVLGLLPCCRPIPRALQFGVSRSQLQHKSQSLQSQNDWKPTLMVLGLLPCFRLTPRAPQVGASQETYPQGQGLSLQAEDTTSSGSF